MDAFRASPEFLKRVLMNVSAGLCALREQFVSKHKGPHREPNRDAGTLDRHFVDEYFALLAPQAMKVIDH